MKKKAIEQIPFKRTRSKDGAIAHIEEIKGESMLLIDEWKDGEPKRRYVLTDKEFANCVNGKWQMTRLGKEGAPNLPETSKKVITKYFGKTSTRNWDCYIRNKEYAIDNARANRKMTLREERLQERTASLYELPVAWEQYIEEAVLPEHHLYYERKGSYAKVFCSACGEEYKIKTKASDSYEGQFETIHTPPKHREKCICPKCGAVGTYIAAGKEKNGSSIQKSIYLVQPTKDKGIVVRYFEAAKKFNNGIKDEIEWIEIVRGYIKDGRLQRDYNKYDRWSNKSFWDDCNLYGMANIQMYDGIVHPASWNVLKEGRFKYIDVEKILSTMSNKGLAYTIANIAARPQIELLQKAGYDWAVRQLCTWYSLDGIYDMQAKRLEDFFKVNKERLKDLKLHSSNLELYQFERELGMHFKADQIRFLSFMQLDVIKDLMKFMSLQQCINRVCKYAEVEITEDMPIGSKSRLRATATTYRDYLGMRQTEGYDMSNSVYLHPRNLKAEHDKLVIERESKRDERYMQSKENKFNKIPKLYKKLKRHFEYSDGTLNIRPARTATEIILEGRVQHHCVGGDTYLDRHNEGESFILFLRHEEDKKTAYYTIEMDWNYEVKQFYAAHDKQPNKEEIEGWLKKYKKIMQAKQKRKTSNERLAAVG